MTTFFDFFSSFFFFFFSFLSFVRFVVVSGATMIEAAFVALHEAIGGDGVLPLDQLKGLMCILFVLPIGFMSTFIPSSWKSARHWLSIFISTFLMSICIDEWAMVHSLFTACVTYLMVWKLPPNAAPYAVFIFAMGYMSASHIYRMITDWGGWHLDFTASQMVVTLKLISFAFCVSDGQKSPEKMGRYQTEHRLTTLPSPLEFFGFIYFFPSFLTGPPIEMADYLKWADGSLYTAGNKTTRPPWTIAPALKQLFLAFLFFIPYGVSALYPPSFLLSDEFAQYNFLARTLINPVIMGVARSKYYLLWYLAEAGFISCGFAYNGEKDGVIDWTRTKNVYPTLCEFGDNVQVKTRGWNIKVSDWLKYYVYLRLMPEGARSPPLYVTLVTYGVSAFWHGFYPGYYLFFLTFAILDQLARKIKNLIRPHFLPEGSTKKMFYNALCFLCCNTICNYIGVSFVIIESIYDVFDYWKSQFYWGHIAVFSLFAVLTIAGSFVKKEKKDKKN